LKLFFRDFLFYLKISAVEDDISWITDLFDEFSGLGNYCYANLAHPILPCTTQAMGHYDREHKKNHKTEKNFNKLIFPDIFPNCQAQRWRKYFLQT